MIEVYILDDDNIITNRIVAEPRYLKVLEHYAVCDEYPPAEIGDPLPDPFPPPGSDTAEMRLALEILLGVHDDDLD